MMTRFASVDDLLKSIKESKFPFVGIPHSFAQTFPNIIFLGAKGECKPGMRTMYLTIKGEEFLVIENFPELKMCIIQVPGN